MLSQYPEVAKLLPVLQQTQLAVTRLLPYCGGSVVNNNNKLIVPVPMAQRPLNSLLKHSKCSWCWQ